MTLVSQISNSDTAEFAQINRGFNMIFKPDRLSIGLVVPLENYSSNPVPTMADQLARIQFAEQLGFSAVWLRDVPFNVPSFGDAGQLYDPFVYLGYLAASTKNIALGVSSIILPLRHPAHVAKAAMSADALSGGRLVLGVASGDRPQEYPALKMDYDNRGGRFRDSFNYIRYMSESGPSFENGYGTLRGDMDMLPKPTSGRLPLLVTGGSQQPQSWTAKHADGWMTYPREFHIQERVISGWKDGVANSDSDIKAKPVMQPLYIDLTIDADTPPHLIHLGFRCGVNFLNNYLQKAERIGVNHIALNLRFNAGSIERTLENLAETILPNFPAT